MTGSYLWLGLDPLEMHALAHSLGVKGDQLAGELGAALTAVAGLDTDATFPPDDFTREFLASYHQPVPDQDGDTTPANVAVRRSAGELGGALAGLGRSVSQLMLAYGTTDRQNADEIRGAGDG